MAHASARAIQAFACTFCPGQNKVPDSKQVVPWGSHLGACCWDYKGWQRLSKSSGTGRRCNYRPRACCSPGLAPDQVTKFSLRTHRLNFVSRETQHKHRPRPLPFPQPGAASEFLRVGAGTTQKLRYEHLGGSGTSKTTLAQLTQVLTMGSINPPAQGDNVPKAA